MSIEDKLNKRIQRFLDCDPEYIIDLVAEWTWDGELASETVNRNRALHDDPHELDTLYQVHLEIEQLIKDAELMECLTSPSKYIRELKKHYEKSRRTN